MNLGSEREAFSKSNLVSEITEGKMSVASRSTRKRRGLSARVGRDREVGQTI